MTVALRGPSDRLIPEDGGRASFRNLVFNCVIDGVQMQRKSALIPDMPASLCCVIRMTIERYHQQKTGGMLVRETDGMEDSLLLG